MLVTGFPAGAFAANCYVIAPADGEECVIVDPGQDALGGIDEVVATHRLKPVAAIATHGHLDHVWSIAPLCGARGIPAYIHPDDRVLLSDPARGLALGTGQQLFGGLTFTEPDDVRELTDGMTLTLAREVPNIVGVKEASGDMAQVGAVIDGALNRRPGATVVPLKSRS